MTHCFRARILAPASLADMTKTVPVPQTRPPFHAASYGLGLMSDPDATGGAIYGHTGEGPGYHAAAYRFGSTTIAVLINARDRRGKIGVRTRRAAARR